MRVSKDSKKIENAPIASECRLELFDIRITGVKLTAGPINRLPETVITDWIPGDKTGISTVVSL